VNQVRIKREFGDLVIEYSTLEDLQSKLDEIEKVEQIVASKIGVSLSQYGQRKPKPGYQDVYRFLPDGTVELLLFPTKKVQRAALVLFAYDQAVPAAVIEKCTNIHKVISKVLTVTGSKEYFTRTKDGKYSLSPGGLTWVTSTLIPQLRQKKSSS